MSEENKTDRRNPEFVAITFSLIESFPKMSKEQAGDAIQTISKYAISIVNGKPAEIDDLSNEICSIMALGCAKSTIDRTLNQFFIKSENGKKGGAPKGNQNARKKKRPEPELEPEEVTEDLTDEAEPVPDPDPEPDREPEPKTFAILKPIERRAAEIVLHENDFDFLDRFDTKQLDELFTFAVLSEYSPGELAAAAQEADSVLNAAREKAESLYKSRNEEKWFIPDFAFILDKLSELRQLPAEELETACQKYDERTETA